MDKSILDKLIKFGFVTNVNVDASKYKDVDDLIVKGLITVPGAKQKINELLGDLNVEKVFEEPSTDTATETTETTTEPVIDEPTTVIETLPVEPATVTETPVEEETTTVTETPVEEETTTVTETTEAAETTKKTVKKTTKKTE